MSVRLTMVQPRTDFGPDAEAKNLALAEQHVTEAVADGAQLVCFPESFPGSWTAPVHSTPVEAMRDIAARHRVHLVFGFAEPLDDDGRRCWNSLALIGPDGEEIGRYRRTSPAQTPWLYEGGDYWDFDWVNAVDLPVFDTALGRIGLLICSEIFATELARILAAKGAEIILMPAGIVAPDPNDASPFGDLYDSWRILTRARALENLACTAVSSNIIHEGGRGVGMICSPEGVLAQRDDEGLLTADLDLDRVRWLRDAYDQQVAGGAGWRTKPGNLRDWRRAEVFAANADAFPGLRADRTDV